ncbi:MAG: DUF4397 domain-containing protein [Propionibacteriaceae bacterium]
MITTKGALRPMIWVRVAISLALALAATGFALSPGYAASWANLYVVQGLPGEKVSFSVDGKTVATGVEGAAVAGPFRLSSGKHTVKVTRPGQDSMTRTVNLKPRSSTDAVLHLPAKATGAPVLTTYTNDLSAVPPGKASLTVAHTAAVPPADIVVNGKVLFANVANGESLRLVVPAATYTVKIVPTGKKSPVVLGPLDLKVKPGSLNLVYAFGDPSDKTMNVAVHTIAVGAAGSSRPSEVNTGSGGQAVGFHASPWSRLLAS